MILKQNKVVCKKCNKILTVANPKGLRSAYCTCGICHSRIEVNFWVEDKSITTSPDRKNDGMNTSLPSPATVKEHEAYLLVNGREYALSVGNNVVGRWSPVAEANVQLEVQDRYLSRQHVMINVYRHADGNLRITVKNYKNKNTTFVNGRALRSDTLVVVDGDTITMAETTAVIVVKASEQNAPAS